MADGDFHSKQYKFATANSGCANDSRNRNPARGFDPDMFKFLFRHRNKGTAVEQKLAIQRQMERRRRMEERRELAMRANIASKLKSYNADEDTTISNFTLAEDEVERKLSNKSAGVKGRDVWGEANPSETGRWRKENKRRRDK